MNMDASSQPARSASMPSKTYNNSLRVVEEALNKLRSQDILVASASASVGAEAIQHGILSLVELYGHVQELILSSSTQQALLRFCREKLEEALDDSVALLDVCTTVRNLMLKLKEHVRDLQSALRRRGVLDIENERSIYLSFRRRMTKDAAKCIGGLKQMETKYGLLLTLPNIDPHLASVIRVQREVYGVTISVFRSLFVFLSTPIKGSGWTLVSRLFTKGSGAASKRGSKMFSEVSDVDLVLCSDAKMDMELVQGRLQALDSGIRCLDGELECLSKRLVRTRVSLLNILTC